MVSTSDAILCHVHVVSRQFRSQHCHNCAASLTSGSASAWSFHSHCVRGPLYFSRVQRTAEQGRGIAGLLLSYQNGRNGRRTLLLPARESPLLSDAQSAAHVPHIWDKRALMVRRVHRVHATADIGSSIHLPERSSGVRRSGKLSFAPMTAVIGSIHAARRLDDSGRWAAVRTRARLLIGCGSEKNSAASQREIVSR
jgi:hypothetical protein